MAKAEGAEKGRLRDQWNDLFKLVHSEKLGEMAAEFDRVHCVERALQVGALNAILPPQNLRPFLIDAVDRGISRCQGGERARPAREIEEQASAKSNDRVKVAAAD